MEIWIWILKVDLILNTRVKWRNVKCAPFVGSVRLGMSKVLFVLSLGPCFRPEKANHYEHCKDGAFLKKPQASSISHCPKLEYMCGRLCGCWSGSAEKKSVCDMTGNKASRFAAVSTKHSKQGRNRGTLTLIEPLLCRWRQSDQQCESKHIKKDTFTMVEYMLKCDNKTVRITQIPFQCIITKHKLWE